MTNVKDRINRAKKYIVEIIIIITNLEDWKKAKQKKAK